MARALGERFWEKVGPTGFCWEWNGCRGTDGYGQIRDGKSRVRAHRVAYELLVGPIPDGLFIDHLCRVRHCVNPDHLEPVTHKENMRRSWRAVRSHCVNGHPFDNEKRRKDGSRACNACVRERHQRVYGHTPRVPLKDRSHCSRGHSLAGANLDARPGKRTRCRACSREGAAAAWRRKREASNA